MKISTFEIGPQRPLFFIAGPCVIESRDFALRTAEKIARIAERVGVPVIYKSSFDKANRTSHTSPRGPGIDEGLAILAEVRDATGLPVLTDVHNPDDVTATAEVVDVLQTPAFLCRQTDLIQAVASCGKPVNIKKGQFLSPNEMTAVVNKANEAGGEGRVMVCERGSSFGYNTLVVDMRSLAIMRDTHCPVVFDATHSVQQPGGLGNKTGGQREHIPVLARAAVAVGVDGIFMETHPDPAHAWSDAANAWPLDLFEQLLISLKQIDEVSAQTARLEEQV